MSRSKSEAHSCSAKPFVQFFFSSNPKPTQVFRNWVAESSLPRCWSEPCLGNMLRSHLSPPFIQHAEFDDTVSDKESKMNI